MVIFESEFGKTTLFSAKITFYSLLLATKKVLVRNCGCSQSIVSQTLIETAIKVRIMQDFLKADSEEGTDLSPIEVKINAAHVVGHFVPNLSALPIREACNKIIHANEMSLVWIDAKEERGQYEFWNGTVNLDGCKGKEPWFCQLYTQIFCTAMEHFLSQVEERVDWYHIYKFDE